MSKLFQLANPTRFRRVARPVLWLCTVLGATLFGWGLYLGLIASPEDYLQKDAVRIMYIHVPAAWLALMTYASMGVAAFSLLVWKHTLAGFYLRAAAPLGLVFTLVCLITGSIWGYPTWGTWWVWDARLTSVLILFFIYLGIITVSDAFENREKGLWAAAWLTLIGMVNLPIIKFSVEWWNTLHQPASITSFARLAKPAIDTAMLTPLFVMAGGYLCLFIVLVILRLDSEMRARRLDIMKLRRAADA